MENFYFTIKKYTNNSEYCKFIDIKYFTNNNNYKKYLIDLIKDNNSEKNDVEIEELIKNLNVQFEDYKEIKLKKEPLHKYIFPEKINEEFNCCISFQKITLENTVETFFFAKTDNYLYYIKSEFDNINDKNILNNLL